jgi:3-deoxy-manno-octulosonate cytidylyltransferase (CMP-KDO synthetase)
MKVVVMIPARLAATRLPNKPLVDIAGKPMVQWVYEKSLDSDADGVFIVTPDLEISQEAQRFGAPVIMTSHAHQTGTDRLAEAITKLPESVNIIVNVQGDEPRITADAINSVITPLLEDEDLAMSTLACELPDDRFDDPNTVKVVVRQNGDALYFSRAGIPFPRAVGFVKPKQHVGLYAYRRQFLTVFPTLDRTQLEQTESLEQLRALEHGYRIRVVSTDHVPESVDTAEDLERVRALFSKDQA